MTDGPRSDTRVAGRFGFVAGRWDFSIVALSFLALFVGQGLGAGLGKILGLGESWTVVASMSGFVLAFAVAYFVVGLVDAPRTRALGLDMKLSRGVRHAALYFLPLFGIVFAATLITTGIARVAGIELPPQNALLAFTDPDADMLVRLGIVVIAVVLAPLTEELLFRGVLHGWLRRRFTIWPAAVISSLAFGLVHFEGQAASLLRVVPLGVMGLCLVWLRESRGGLWSCITFHALFNASALLVAASVADGTG